MINHDPNISKVWLSPAKIEGAVNYFHVSSNWLGNTFTLTPRIPTGPYVDEGGWVIEDTTTPRISLATSLRKAYKAVNASMKWDDLYVYGTRNDIDVVVPFGDTRPHSPRNPYGPTFSLSRYLDWVESKGWDLPTDKQERELFTHLVPDAKRTGEVWALEPTDVVILGEVRWNKFYLAKWIEEKASKKLGAANEKWKDPNSILDLVM
jgi:hypothetical protein